MKKSSKIIAILTVLAISILTIKGLTEIKKARADVNCDGKVTALDIECINKCTLRSENMAIQNRRGPKDDFDPNKMTAAEWAFPDDGSVYFCVRPGEVEKIATESDVIRILESQPNAFNSLKLTLTYLENEGDILTGILSDISNLLANTNQLNLDSISHINDIDAHGILNIRQKIEKVKLSDIQEPFYICHRGACNIFPENTLEGFRGCVALGNPLVEMDVQTLSDGVLGVMHDSTVDRTTDKVGDTSSYSAMGFRKLNVDVMPTVAKAPLFEDVVSSIGKNAIYCVESKDKKSVEKIIETLNRYDLKEYALIQSMSMTDLQIAVEEGYETLLITSSVSPTTIKSAGIGYVGVSKTATDAYIQDCINVGLKVIIYTVNRRHERDKFLAKGVTGFFSDDPFYLSSAVQGLTNDPFNNQTYHHGMINSLTDRGKFFTPNKFGFETLKPGIRDFIMQGWAGELPSEFVMDLTVSREEITDQAWMSIAICTPNDFFDDGESGESSDGYHILLSDSGWNHIYIRHNDVTTKLITQENSPSAIGVDILYRLTVTPTTITLKDITHNYGNLTIVDSTFRGGYFHIGRKTTRGKFSNISIT